MTMKPDMGEVRQLVRATDQVRELSIWEDPARLDIAMKAATVFSKSEMVPKHFRGRPNDIVIVMGLANNLGVDPLMALHNVYVVHGTPALKATFAIAIANRSGVFDGPIRFEASGEGDDFGVTAWALLHDGTRVERRADMRLAKGEGWAKANPKYNTPLREQMLAYRAAVLLIRLYAPDALSGYQTAEEVRDVRGAERHMGTAEVIPAGTATERLAASLAPKPTPAEPEPDIVEVEDEAPPAEVVAPELDEDEVLIGEAPAPAPEPAPKRASGGPARSQDAFENFMQELQTSDSKSAVDQVMRSIPRASLEHGWNKAQMDSLRKATREAQRRVAK